MSLLHKLELLENLLLDLLWVLLDPLLISKLESLPHCILLLAFQDEPADIHLVSRFEKLLRCELEALLLPCDLVQLIARALDQLIRVRTVDEALSIDSEAKLYHFVQLGLLLFQLIDVKT